MGPTERETIIKFLEESNKIEDVFDSLALDKAVDAWDFLIARDTLTIPDILEAHDILMEKKLAKHLRGKFRKVKVFIGNNRVGWHKGFPAKAIPKAMEDWLIAVDLTLNLKGWGEVTEQEQLEREIQRDHVMFEKIHPFIDGNGRIGRILLNWQRVKVGLPVLIIWADERQDYYQWFKA
jgi:Fic family protein